MKEHSLELYNTLSRTKQLFTPVQPGHVGMYVCGPTVYGDAHLGHARPAITFDVLFRYLTWLGYKVRYVRNITDVGHLEHDADEGEDKIAKKARLEQLEPMEVVQHYLNRYHRDMEALNVLPPSIEPHASGHIIEQIEYIKKILESGYAYESCGSVYFDVTKYNADHRYGKLSGRNIDDMLKRTRPASSTASTRNATRSTSPSGRRPRPSTSCTGHRPGAKASPAGISNVPQWAANIWATPSTSTAEAWTSCSPTTSARSPRASPRKAMTPCATGCTTT